MLREPLRGPSAYTLPQPGQIVLHHPAYNLDESVLLTLRGCDSPSGGIVYDLAHCACAILADNRFDGFLSTSPDVDAQPIQPGGILEPGDYYYHLGGPAESDLAPQEISAASPRAGKPYCYPIIPEFRRWRFSRNNIGRFAKYLDPGLIPARDGSAEACAVSEHVYGTDSAHIIPESEAQWFLNNGMHRLFSDGIDGSVVGLVNSDENKITLRTDIHRLWDSNRLIFFPKADDNGELQLVIHAFDVKPQLVELYHNRRVPRIRRVPSGMLFARLAWSIFPITSFLAISTRRFLRVREQSLSAFSEKWHSPEESYKFQSAPRSSSPRKRRMPNSRFEPSTTDSLVINTDHDPIILYPIRRPKRVSDTGSGDVDSDSETEQGRRGRSRKRRQMALT